MVVFETLFEQLLTVFLFLQKTYMHKLIFLLNWLNLYVYLRIYTYKVPNLFLFGHINLKYILLLLLFHYLIILIY